MKFPFVIVVTMAAVLPLGACGMMNKLTKQTDDTVLPGPREEAIPGRAQFPAEGEKLPKSPTATAEAPASAETLPDAPPADKKKPCAADDPKCLPPLTDNDTFSDGQ